MHNRSLAYLHLEKASQALEDAQAVQALNPNFARAYFSQAQALEKLGRKYEALAAYRQFLKFANPETDAALLKQALERLKTLQGK